MSALPAVGPNIAATATGILQMINPIDSFLNALGTNPYFIGIMMLLLNLGGRFLGLEITKEQEKFFQQVWVRRFFIFSVLFIATRNILTALFLSIIVLLLLSFLFNENSDLYLGSKTKIPPPEATNLPGLTQEETEILRRLTDKQSKFIKAAQDAETAKQTQSTSVEQVYNTNMSFLGSIVSGR